MSGAYRTAAAFRQALEARLEAAAARRGVGLNTLRQMVLMERLLARLFPEIDATAGEPPPWLLKGGYAMELRMRPRARTTRDLDFTAWTDPELVEDARREAVLDRLQAAAQRSVGDHLVFEVHGPGTALAGPTEGGWRFKVDVALAGKTYGGFHVDVGLDGPVPGIPEVLTGEDHLAFAGIPPAVVLAVPRAVQFAEKLAAYTRPWTGRVNTRTKDLVDLLLLIDAGLAVDRDLAAALRRSFSSAGRGVPQQLPRPPGSWRQDFEDMERETGQQASGLDVAYERLSAFWVRVREVLDDGGLPG